MGINGQRGKVTTLRCTICTMSNLFLFFFFFFCLVDSKCALPNSCIFLISVVLIRHFHLQDSIYACRESCKEYMLKAISEK